MYNAATCHVAVLLPKKKSKERSEKDQNTIFCDCRLW